MKLKIMKTAVCRTPAFGLNDVIEEVWEDLKQKIKDSSPVFYQSIEDVSIEQLDSLNQKIRYTIWKYFKRAKYRATPFGSFSAINLVLISDKEKKEIKISDKMLVHQFLDWSEKDVITDDVHSILNTSTVIYKNSSIYYVNGEIRYIRTKNSKFEIATIISFPQLWAILKICSTHQCLSAITSKMQSKFGMKKEQTISLLRQMLSLQLLITSRFPNITGEDYFTRIGFSKPLTDIRYLISERILINGSLDYMRLRNIPELIKFMALNIPDSYSQDLSDFKFAFQKRFEHREISLAMAMDPEIGIGYGKLEQQVENDTLNIFKSVEMSVLGTINITYSDLHAFILNRLILDEPIQLDEFNGNEMSRRDREHRRQIDTNRFTSDKNKIYPNENITRQTLPNTLSVLLRFWNGICVIESMGGSTANSLLGRFTMVDKKFETYGRNIASIEEKANPDVMFFDIAYQAEKKKDNVNRRRMIYEKELPILTWSCSANALDFEDIMVSVKGNKVMLRSKKYGKRLIPRIPSAYNYTRSDLAVYRFLCDIQNQDMKVDLNFNPRKYFPNLQRYPRMNYKTIIVSPAMWLVPKTFIGYKKQDIHKVDREVLSAWLKTEGINFMFKAGDTDSTLCFDPSLSCDMDAFLMYCRQHQHVDLYISEALVPNDDDVWGENGKKYASQFIVNYYHEHEIYEKIVQPKQEGELVPTNKRILIPGSDWLYYELYCYPTRSNNLLLAQLKDFLNEIKPYINKWFFIRHDNPSTHLRLRLHMKEPLLAYMINRRLTDLIEPFVYSGQINDFCIRTYIRELERYGANRLDVVEKFFHKDSEYVLSIIAKVKDVEQLYITTIFLIQNVFLADLSSIDEQIEFAKSMADNFAIETNMNPIQYRELNRTFNQFNKYMEDIEILVSSQRINYHKKALSKVLIGTNENEKKRLIADLIHMHINRLFASDQRLHETIIYHYLMRHLMAYRARLNYQGTCKF